MQQNLAKLSLNCDETHKLKLQKKSSKTQIVTKLKNSDYDKTQKLKFEPNLTTKQTNLEKLFW